MICRSSQADVNVVGLVGERGRELNDFIRNSLGPAGLAKSVVVAATSDMPPLVRARGAESATAIAEYFRNQGKSVLLPAPSAGEPDDDAAAAGTDAEGRRSRGPRTWSPLHRGRRGAAPA